MEEVWRAHKPWVGKKCSQKKINKGGCPKVEEYRTAVCLQNEKNLKSKVALMVKILRDR